MIKTEATRERSGRRGRTLSALLALQFLLPPALAILVTVAPAIAAPVETQDAASEVMTAQFVFNGTDGSAYASTRAGPQGAELGYVARNFTLGRGVWGDGAVQSGLRVRYPGNLTLGAAGEANEVFVNRLSSSGRDTDANGAFVWSTGTTNSLLVGTFDADGDGILDDVFLANNSNLNSLRTWNEAGTAIGNRRIGTNFGLTDVIAVDANGDGRLEQLAVAHPAGRVYLEPPNVAADVWVYNLPVGGALMLTVADFDNDSFLENVVVGNDDTDVYALSPSGAQVWAYDAGGPNLVTIKGYWPAGSPAQNGVLVAAQNAVTALNWNGVAIWNHSANATVTTAAPADLDGDGLLDDAIYGDAAGGLTLLNETGAVVGYAAPFGNAASGVVTADLEGAGRPGDFVAVNDTALVGLDGQLATMWTYRPPASARINKVIAADLDGDGTLGDSVLGTGTSVFAINRTGGLRWNYTGPFSTTHLAFVENPGVTAGGTYDSPPLDAGTLAAWGNLTTGFNISTPNEILSASVRFGTGTPGNLSWGSWSAPALPAFIDLSGNASRFVQVRYTFNSTDAVDSANLSWFRVDFGTPAFTGSVQTTPLSAAPQAQWIDLDAQYNLSGGAVRFLYSGDGGASWHAFTPPSAVDAGNVSSPSLVLRVEMDVGTASPNVAWLKVRYGQPGLRPLIATPVANSSVTGVVNVSAAADPLVLSVSFWYRDLSGNTTVAIGPGVWDGASSRWYVLWNTSALNMSAASIAARGTDARAFQFTGTLSPVLVDNSPPTGSITSPALGGVLHDSALVNVTASPDTVSVAISYRNSSGIFPLGAATQISPGLWQIAWDTVAAGIGEEESLGLYATAVDRVGLSSTFVVDPVVVDNVAPWIVIDAPLNGSSVGGVFKVNVTAAPDVVSIELFQNGSEGFAVRTGGDAVSSTWVANWSTFPDVVNDAATLVAMATDRAGHIATASAIDLHIDNTAPDITLVSPALPGAYTGTVRLVAAAPGADDYLTFSYKVAGQSHLIVNLSAGQKNASSGFFEYAWDTQGLNFAGSIVVEAAPVIGLVGVRVVDGLVVDNARPFITFNTPGGNGQRLDGNYTVEVIADLDTVSVMLSYTNLGTGEVVVLGPMTHLSLSTRWQYAWAIGTTFVPYAALTALAVDGVGLNNSDTRTGLIIGLNPNDQPPQIVRAPSTVVVDEDFGTYEINVTGLIVDDDPANVTVYIDGVNPALVTLRNNGSRGASSHLWLVSVKDAHSVGADSDLELRVVDASGQTAVAPFKLFVQSRNDPPSWVSPHDTIYVQAGVPVDFDFSLYVHDVEFENEHQPLTITTGEEAARITQDNALPLTLHFNYPASMAGQTVAVNYSLSDGDANFVPQVFAGRVIVTNDAIPRLIKPLPDITLLEDTPKFNILDLHAYFNDSDQEPLFYYTGLNQSFGVRIEAGVFSIDRLPLNWNGNASLFLGARDFVGAFVEARINLTVLPVNDAPAWDFTKGLAINDFFVHFGLPFLFDLGPYTYDVDSDRSSLLVMSSDLAHAHALTANVSSGLPGEGLVLVLDYGLAFDGQNVTVILFVSDGTDNSTTISVVVHVSDNYPPQTSKPLPLEIVLLEGETLSPALTLSDYFTDPDGFLFYAFGLLNVHYDIDQNTSVVTLSSTGEWSGTETMIIRAIDNRSAFKDSYIVITVIPVNDAPIIKVGNWDLKVDAGTLGTLFVGSSISDPDTPIDKLTYTVSSAYPGAFVAYSNGNVTFVYPKPADPAAVPPAFDTLRLCVSDGELTTCKIISVRIVQPLSTAFNWLQFILFVGTAGIGAIVVARHFVEFKIKRAPTVEDIFLVYEDGILMKHISKNVRKYADEDVVTSMLSAIQSFAADSFEDKTHWELREVQFQGRKILIEKAKKFQIYLIFDGDANEDLKKAVLNAAKEISRVYKVHLRDWDGDPSHFDGVEKIFAPVLAVQSAYIPGEVTADELVKAPLVPGEVYVSEADGFGPLLKAYGKDLEGVAVVRIRPAEEASASIDALKPSEVEIVEIPPARGAPEDDDSPRTGLDIAIDALKEALTEAKVAVRGRAPLVMFEGFAWVLDRYGFVFSKKFSDQLKKLAAAEGFYLFIAVDTKSMSAQQLEGVERGAVVFRGA